MAVYVGPHVANLPRHSSRKIAGTFQRYYQARFLEKIMCGNVSKGGTISTNNNCVGNMRETHCSLAIHLRPVCPECKHARDDGDATAVEMIVVLMVSLTYWNQYSCHSPHLVSKGRFPNFSPPTPHP